MRNEICEYASESRARAVRDLLANLFGFRFIAPGGKIPGPTYELEHSGAFLRLYLEKEEIGKGPNRRYRVILEARKP